MGEKGYKNSMTERDVTYKQLSDYVWQTREDFHKMRDGLDRLCEVILELPGITPALAKEVANAQKIYHADDYRRRNADD